MEEIPMHRRLRSMDLKALSGALAALFVLVAANSVAVAQEPAGDVELEASLVVLEVYVAGDDYA